VKHPVYVMIVRQTQARQAEGQGNNQRHQL
jgi:hypothetical protein